MLQRKVLPRKVRNKVKIQKTCTLQRQKREKKEVGMVGHTKSISKIQRSARAKRRRQTQRLLSEDERESEIETKRSWRRKKWHEREKGIYGSGMKKSRGPLLGLCIAKKVRGRWAAGEVDWKLRDKCATAS